MMTYRLFQSRRSIPFILFALLFAPACKDKTPDHRIDENIARVLVTGPGDPIAGLLEPGSHPVKKINIRGVVKNSVEVRADKPVRLQLPNNAVGVAFGAGVAPGTAGPVKFKILAGETVIKEIEIAQDSQDKWKEASVKWSGQRRKEITIETDLSGPGAFVAHPRPLVPSPQKTSVFFILIDALRADGLGAYGAGGNPSPNIDGLARNGTVFSKAYTSAPFTLTSTASIFTGLFPWQHRVLFKEGAGLRLADTVPTLVERFRAAGYHTAAFSGTYFLFSSNGLAREFDHFDETCAPKFFGDSAGCLNQRVTAWLSEHAQEPVFVYIHYIDPHAPYYAPEPLKHHFTKGLKKPKHEDVAMGEIEQFGEHRKWHQFYRSPSVSDLKYLRGLYQGEVAYVDARIGELLERIDKLNFKDPLILITSDHGEAFYEHHELDHVRSLHEPVMRVPLIIKGARVPRGKAIKEPARTIDMIPTLLHLCQIKPPTDIPGRSLVPLLVGRTLPPAPAAAVHFLDGKEEYAMVFWPWKLFHRPESGRSILYRLDEDPGETNDLAEGHPAELKAMTDLLEHTLSLQPPDPGKAPPIDKETLERLKALGYIGD